MNKILFFSSLLLLTNLSFAAPTNNPESSATMEIKARVLQPITVEVTNNIDLGNIIAGTFVESESYGSFKITGEKEANYYGYFKEFQESPNGGVINLTHEDGVTLLPMNISTQLPYSNFTLSRGSMDVNIYASNTIPENQKPGEYSGSLTLAVRYE